MTPTLPSAQEVFRVMPEIWLVAGMCAVILVPFINRRSVTWPTYTAIGTLILALAFSIATLGDPGGLVFDGMLAIDPFSQFFKVLLLLFTVFIIAQWSIATKSETSVYDVPDFHCLLLGATFGMALMASANNLLMIVVATETASLSSFALAGFRKQHRVGSEGALKYVLFGAVSSAIMIYGMSLVYGATGQLGLAQIASAATFDFSPLLAIGLLAMFTGIAFKLSAVPLHFWCPDVFQGASFEVTTFLSVASKGAAVAILLRILYVFGAQVPPQGTGFIGMATGVAVLGGVTATWGNLLAYHQTNIKRLLAYSSIAHSGYMIMASSLMVLVRTNDEPQLATSVGSAILFYLLVYMFMNLGAFTVGAVIAKQTHSEDIRDYAGLINRSPMLCILLVIFLLSLFGMPGLGGFMGKMYLMVAMANAGGAVGLALIVILLINTLISLYYYLRPIYYMVLVPDMENRPSVVPRLAPLVILLTCGVALLWTGLLPSAAFETARTYSPMVSGTTVAATVPPDKPPPDSQTRLPVDPAKAVPIHVTRAFP